MVLSDNQNIGNMEIKDYAAPQAEVIEVNAQKVLCLSGVDGENTERFTLGDQSYGDDDFE